MLFSLKVHKISTNVILVSQIEEFKHSHKYFFLIYNIYKNITFPLKYVNYWKYMMQHTGFTIPHYIWHSLRGFILPPSASPPLQHLIFPHLLRTIRNERQYSFTICQMCLGRWNWGQKFSRNGKVWWKNKGNPLQVI